MKLRKLLMCLFASIIVIGMSSTHTYAAQIAQGAVEGIAALVGEDAQATEESILDTKDEEAVIEENKSNDSNESEKTVKKETKKETKKEKTETKKAQKTKKEKAKKTASIKEAEKEKSYTKAELRLLASLIFCEAGIEPYAGKLAVGIVVVNREESSRFPNSIKSVIYQKSQFGPARNGSLSRALSRYDNGTFTSENEKDCIKAAKKALSGTKEVTYKGKKINMKSYLFFSGRVSGARLRIANHDFK